ncbi:MAG TPA: flippase [Candidatus Desulfofervidus auxilii]|uniref:Flippase n=1 Tax=Desulfofervidus auxilii TaxID=1621989 RepID=A0A7V1I4Z7_DESA2|nr:flippase [Candidatus Desulfofervidus auxilii]
MKKFRDNCSSDCLASTLFISTKPTEETTDQLIKQVAKGGGIAFGGSVIGKVAALGLNVLLGRVLGPGAYGLYVLGISVIGIAQSIASLGLNQGVVRFCSMYRGERDNARVKGTLLSALGISSVSSVLMAAILFALSDTISERFFNEPELSSVLRVFALVLPFYVLMGITTSFAQSFRRIDYQQGVQIFRLLVNFALVSLAFLLGFRLAGAVYGFLASGVLSAGLGFYFLWRIFPEAILNSQATYRAAQLLRFSFPMFLIGISYFLLSYTDRIMLGYFGQANDVGVYNAATILSMNIVIFIAAIISIFSPILADLHNKRKYNEIKSLYKVTTRWIIITSSPLFLILALFPDTIMSIFGVEYQIGSRVLIILAFAYFVGAATGPGGVILQMSGKQDIDLVNGTFLVIVNIALNIWLIPVYGVIGAALATCITLTLIHVARFIEVYKIFKMIPYDFHILKPLVAGIIAAVPGVLFNVFSNPGSLKLAYIGLPLVVFIYGISLWGMGLHPQDKIILLAIIRKFCHVI